MPVSSSAAASAPAPLRTAPPAPQRSRHTRARASLAWRTFVINATILVVAGVGLAITPVTVSSPIIAREAAILLGGVAVSLVVNLVLVRRAFAPLQRLRDLMATVDVLRPGDRIDVGGATADVRAIADAFNEMVQRLEDERRDSARRALIAQEAERRRIGREMHDELGQTLTGVLLQLDAAAQAHPGEPELADAREAARGSLEQVRRIARDLRPDTLDDLGIASALTALCARFARESGIEVDHRLAPDLPPLPRETELVLYRVAQESLTNVARHAGARRVDLRLERDGDDAVALVVMDDGRGRAPRAHEGSGIRGMRERALLARGTLEVAWGADGGTRVRLRVPVEDVPAP